MMSWTVGVGLGSLGAIGEGIVGSAASGPGAHAPSASATANAREPPWRFFIPLPLPSIQQPSCLPRHPVWNSKESTTGAAASTARSKAASRAVIRIARARADPPGRSRT
jgi:hypothetical protein